MEVFTDANQSYSNVTLAETVKQPFRATFEIDEDMYEIYAKIINVVLTPALCIAGLCGNGLGLYVFLKDSKYQTQSIYRYMLALLAFDNAYLIAGCFFGIVSIIKVYDWYLANAILIHMLYVTATLDMIVYHTTSALLVVMSLERLNALLRPLTVKQTWLNRFPHKIIVLIFLICVAFVLPFPIGVEIITRLKDNQTAYYFQSRPVFLALHRKLHLVETVISCFYPIVLLIINIAIPLSYCRYLKLRGAQLPHVSTNESKQRRITLMVLWVTGLYMLLAIPKVFLQVIIFFVDIEYDHDGKYRRTFYFFTVIGDFFARVNAANDFLIYVLVSDRYRKLLSIMCSRWWIRSDDNTNISDIFRHASHNVTRTRSERESQTTKISVIDCSESVLKAE